MMACRSVERGESAAAEIREAVPNATLDVRECDLADLSNVASFADGLRADYDAVDILCNNAGVWRFRGARQPTASRRSSVSTIWATSP